MKELIKEILIAVVATIVFSITAVLGFILTVVRIFKETGLKGAIKQILDIIGGGLKGLSHMFRGYSEGIDISANGFGGDGLEWLMMKGENVKTMLGNGDNTISAGVGHLHELGRLDTWFAKTLDKLLNISFNEKSHGTYALLAYRDKVSRESQKKKYFK